MKRLLFVVLLGVVSSAVVHAQSAEEMASNCKDFATARVSNDTVAVPSTNDSGICWGAFLSFQSAIGFFGHEYLDGTYSPTLRPIFGVCAPKDSTTSQLIKVFISYTDRHPEQLHKDFFVVALFAGREAFPCAK